MSNSSCRQEEALTFLQELVQTHPHYVQGWSQLGSLYMRTNRTTLAKEAFEAALALDPNDIVTLNNYGESVHCAQELC